MDATELMVGGVVVGLFRENCYIIGSKQTGEAICVDPGDEVDEIKALAREMKVRITRIACSHGHLDHIMAVRALKEETGAPFLLHQQDLEIARNMPTRPGTCSSDASHRHPTLTPSWPTATTWRSPGISLKVIHTPGHTPAASASTAAACSSAATRCFRARSAEPTCRAGSFPQIMDSIITRLLELPDETIVRPGHMDQTTIGVERRTNPFILKTLAQRGS